MPKQLTEMERARQDWQKALKKKNKELEKAAKKPQTKDTADSLVVPNEFTPRPIKIDRKPFGSK